jgi:hypothetical protein
MELPEALLNQIRLLATNRKVEKHAKSTQKAIIVELLEKGLFFAHDELPAPPEPSNSH